jgi:hypothetical protein
MISQCKDAFLIYVISEGKMWVHHYELESKSRPLSWNTHALQLTTPASAIKLTLAFQKVWF